MVLSKQDKDQNWVLDILTKKYEKATHDSSDCMHYLGMVLMKRDTGYEISMQSYIQDILELYRTKIKDYVTPAK